MSTQKLYAGVKLRELRGRLGVKSPPINTGSQPPPLGRRQRHDGAVGAGPGEMPLMQTALAEPDAGAVPNQ